MKVKDLLAVMDDGVKLMIMQRNREGLPVLKFEVNKLEESITLQGGVSKEFVERVLNLRVVHISSPKQNDAFWVTTKSTKEPLL